MMTSGDTPLEGEYRHPVEAELDTAQEQAHALLIELRNSFAPTYLTLISIIQGVLLGLTFQLLADRWPGLGAGDPTLLLVGNNVVLIVLVWNEYRMGSYMFRWVPYLLDALIPFAVGSIQAALVLTVGRPMIWLAWLATFYLAAVIAYENMYRRSAAEQRNAFVLDHNHTYRRLNPAACLTMSFTFAALLAVHIARDTTPGWETWLLVTVLNLAFLVRGELNWQHVIAAARRVAAGEPPGH